MRRREFIGLVGAVAAWPVAARAQQKLPLIGFMDLGGITKAEIVRGLADNGFVEGRNYRGEDSWGNFQPELLGTQAENFVRQGAVLIVANATAAHAAKAATRSIPIVFLGGPDPVQVGLVDSLNRPGGNLTGVSLLIDGLVAKRLELLREMAPAATSIAYISNPNAPRIAEAETRELQAAISGLGVRLLTGKGGNTQEIDAAFAVLVREGAEAMIVSGDVLFWMGRANFARRALAYKLPTIYAARQHVEAGGLISYGTRQADGWYTMGVYAARILKGDKPANLPIQQVTKVKLCINLKTAKEIGLALPPTLLARADEVIE